MNQHGKVEGNKLHYTRDILEAHSQTSADEQETRTTT
jgi:hypothetical protein